LSKFSLGVLRIDGSIQHVQDNQLEEVAVSPADDRDTIELVVRADEQKLVGFLP
jgi:hypothetical protein